MTAAQHAIQALLWSSNFDDFEPSEELVERITEEWEDFRDRAEQLGFDAYEHRAMMVDPAEGDEWDYAAHDFILTRNGHGTGFWDSGRWHEPWGEKLTALCKEYGPVDVWGDENRVAQLY